MANVVTEVARIMRKPVQIWDMTDEDWGICFGSKARARMVSLDHRDENDMLMLMIMRRYQELPKEQMALHSVSELQKMVDAALGRAMREGLADALKGREDTPMPEKRTLN
jgi:hypothetical protein